VDRWVKPDEFIELTRVAEQSGFAGVTAGPLVRSSCRAGKLYAKTKLHRGEALPDNLIRLDASGPAAQEASALLALPLMRGRT
jgi:lipoyl synthase